jgi:hypothetical protein
MKAIWGGKIAAAVLLAASLAGAQSKKGSKIQDLAEALGETRTEFFSSGEAAEQLATCSAGHPEEAFPKGAVPALLCEDIVAASVGGTRTVTIDGKASTWTVTSYKNSDGKVYTEYTFDDGKFAEFELHVPAVLGNDFDVWSQPLVATYGIPTAKQTKQYENGFGATFEGRVWIWDGKSVILAITEIPGPDGEILIRGALKAYLEKQAPKPAPKNPPAKLP